MRSVQFENSSHRPARAPRTWVMETLVVLGIVAFGLFALALEGQFSLLGSQPQNAVALPYELTR